MSIIKDRILHPTHPRTLDTDITRYGDQALVDVIFAKMEQELQETGDRVWLRNGTFSAKGKSHVFGKEQRMLSEVIPMAKRVARVMYHKYGVRRNDVVQNVLTNSTEFFWPIFGAWLCRATASPSDVSLTAAVIAKQMDEIQPKMVFCCQASKDSVEKAVAATGYGTKIVLMDGESTGNIIGFEELLKDSDNLPEVPREEFDHDDVAVIIWSSGSTGRPKGIQFTQRTLLIVWCVKRDSRDSLKGSSVIFTTCFFHIGGFTCPLVYGLMGTDIKLTFVASEDIDNEGIECLYHVVEKVKANAMFLGSHHCVQMAKSGPTNYDLSTVNLMVPLGSNLYNGIKDELQSKFPALKFLMNTYGQTEVAVVLSRSLEQSNLGIVSQDALVKIQDPDTDEILDVNQTGEIMAKPALTMKGYKNRPEENAKFFAGDGWIRTGDLGHYDENGVLYYDGRIKELIKYKNTHLYPIEIEEIIQKVPGVIEVGVFGRPDPSVQELITAAVVVEKDVRLTKEEIVKMVDENVEDFKRLRGGVMFMEKLPRNPQGKILRRKLIEYYDKNIQ